VPLITLTHGPKPTSHYAAWQSSLEQVLQDLYSGAISPEDLNEDLFAHYASSLEKAASNGLKTDLGAIQYDAAGKTPLLQIKRNVYQFAGAKTYSQLKEINAMLYSEKGTRVSKDVFKANATKYYNDAKIIDKKYYDWLNVEYDQADITANATREWHDYAANKDVKNLQYQTVGDDRVRPAHALLNGIIKPKDDPFWKINFPPNGWLCRCDVIETNDDVTTGEINFTPDPGFDFNPGIENELFGDSPYYPSTKKGRERLAATVDKMAIKK